MRGGDHGKAVGVVRSGKILGRNSRACVLVTRPEGVTRGLLKRKRLHVRRALLWPPLCQQKGKRGKKGPFREWGAVNTCT